ncbi:hypothetical protein ACTXJH_12560 [Psychrobacter celer]|uniref:hypothetical protein n=1 Tax=Psychrobacter celer TaxID=306572 RepID=UPI003FD20377
MSKQELKSLQKEFNQKLNDEGISAEFYNHHESLKPILYNIGKDIAERQSTAAQKDYDWMKWLAVIASGVFSVVVSQVTRMSSMQYNQLLLSQNDQLLLFKIAITANALGIVFSVIYLYRDIKTERDLADKLGVQRLYLLLRGTNRYENFIPSSKFQLFRLCKSVSILCFLISIIAWVVFIWVM